MLKNVKDYIDTLDNIPFNQFYIQYMMDVQDSNIEHELKHLTSAHKLNIKSINKLIDNTLGGLVND